MDLIMSRQQNAVLSDIDLYLTLDKRSEDEDTLNDMWFGILADIMDEKDRYPEYLWPDVYWNKKMIFKNRCPRPTIRTYLHKVAAYLQTINSKNLPR